jgi:hypothetical protein
MSLFRLVVLVLLVVWIMRFLRIWQIKVERREPLQPAAPGEPEILRSCTRCGVLVPARSLTAAGICGRCADGGR